MLDQSFSAHDFEVFFDLENQKGITDINWKPKVYHISRFHLSNN